ncbi:MAG TPA: hypothetical protein DIU15_15445 [Deltaproteobacteria bacterium]|nr:hypothetical protein [Deltaproteobacteria bacterium]HCP47435.1 hypothetical protein [Deltaproteobacteria bacterium]
MLTSCLPSSGGWASASESSAFDSNLESSGIGDDHHGGLDTDVSGHSGDAGDPSESSDGVSSGNETLCAQARPIACGQSITSSTADLNEGATSVLDHYEIVPGNYSAPEVLFSWTPAEATAAELVLVGATATQVNHDLFVLENGCWPQDAIEFGFSDVEWEASGQTTYYLVVDGYYEDQGAFTVALDCDAEAPSSSTDSDNADSEQFFSCDDYSLMLNVEAQLVRSCSQDSDCGQVLTGTGCGCATDDLIANDSADTSYFFDLFGEATGWGCSIDFGTSCDCEASLEPVCRSGKCSWR